MIPLGITSYRRDWGALCDAATLLGVPRDPLSQAAHEALTKAGAERPTWAEGQRAYTQLHVERDACCRHCGLPLRSQHVNFCSSPCRSRWWALFNAEAA